MTVGIERHLDARMPHLIANERGRLAVGDKFRSEEVPQVVKACFDQSLASPGLHHLVHLRPPAAEGKGARLPRTATRWRADTPLVGYRANLGPRRATRGA